MICCARTVPTPAADQLAKLPLNQWVQLSETFPHGYTYSAMVWCPQRKQVLHWGAVASARGIEGRNDVRAFDVEKLAWTSDYPSDPDQSWGIVGGGSGRAVSYSGKGQMLASGRPMAAMIVNAAVWDSKRQRMVVSMPGLMADYNPATRKWHDIQATTQLHGLKIPGGPPVYGAGMGYDPIHDEIVMFPHFGAQQADLRKVTGRISGHLGTLRYSYEDNTWRRVGTDFGSPEMRSAREEVIAVLGKISPALDELWRLRRNNPSADVAGPQQTLADAAKEIGNWRLSDAAAERASKAIAALAEATNAKTASASLAAGTRAVWQLEAMLEGPLAVEPPPRSVAPLVYDEKNQVLVMFGGDSGTIRPDLFNSVKDPELRETLYRQSDRRLNDTWIYDCRTRQWRNISTMRRPPAQQVPLVTYDPHSQQVLLLSITGNPYHTRVPRKVTLWSLDVAQGEWQKRSAQDWPGPIDRRNWYTLGIEPENKLLLITHTQDVNQKTFAMRYDIGKLPAEPAPQWQPLPEETPTKLPPDDPAWVAKLQVLPANAWTPAEPPVEPHRRDWGNIACDPVRGWIVYFGGGHSTYQGTDVAIYQVGANRWAYQAGGHNDSLPPVGWGGFHMDVRGGNNAGHMRNQYVALDGRMFVNVGFGSQIKRRNENTAIWDAEICSLPAKPHSWFYDVDLGGVWRQRPSKIDGKLPEPHRGHRDGRPSVVDPAGIVYGIDIVPERAYHNASVGTRIYARNIYTGKTTITEVPAPWPYVQPESRSFCMLPDRQQIFLQDANWKRLNGDEDAVGPATRTLVYDIKANRFIDLEPANQPPGKATGTAYIQDQGVILCAIDTGDRHMEQWVYSLEENRWAQFPLNVAGERKFAFQNPYTQMDYVAKYGVLVNFAGRTFVMRPDFSKFNWQAD
jgi:hypothetical protein